jgi:hypothetical protein
VVTSTLGENEARTGRGCGLRRLGLALDGRDHVSEHLRVGDHGELLQTRVFAPLAALNVNLEHLRQGLRPRKRRIAADIGELARARRIADVSSAGVDADARLRRRRRLAEPAIEPPGGPMSIHQARRAWDAYEHRLQRAGLPVPPNPYRHLSNGR